MRYVIEFNMGGKEPVYAGFVDGAWGITLTPVGVAKFNDQDSARAVLLEAFGAQAAYGQVVPEGRVT